MPPADPPPVPVASASASASAESLVNDYLAAFEFSGHRRSFVLRDPLALVRALRRTRGLERVAVSPSSTEQGALVERIVLAMRNRVHTPLHSVVAVLSIPERAGEYESGSSQQTLRRKVRVAERRGITWEVVDDLERRRSLMKSADVRERTHADVRYRTESTEHDELIEHGLWLVAFAQDGTPLLLSVTPIDGDLGVLRYFRTLRSDDDSSVARYLMTQVLVEHLRLRGVRRLLDTTPSIRLPRGLRHFQRMVGFRLVRVDLTSRPNAPAAGSLLEAALGMGRVGGKRGLVRGALVTSIAAFGSEVLPAILTS